MLVLAKRAAELDRADAERMVEHQVEADRMPFETAEVSRIVALLELRAFLEEVRHRGDRKHGADHNSERHDADSAERDEPHARLAASLHCEEEEGSEQRRDERQAPGRAREGEEDA